MHSKVTYPYGRVVNIKPWGSFKMNALSSNSLSSYYDIAIDARKEKSWGPFTD